jgi:phospholipase C
MATPKRGDHLITRRRFLEATAGTAALAWRGALPGLAADRELPQPHNSGVDRIIVVMMENRSFDHILGWTGSLGRGIDGQQAGLVYEDKAHQPHSTRLLTPDFQGCLYEDPDHSYEGGRTQYNGGACDGWLKAATNDLYPIGYYTDAGLPFFAGAARDWTVCDRYFSPVMGPTFPNRMYQHCAQTDRLTNSFAFSALPTIWDRILDGRIRGRYYFSDVPFLALWGPKYVSVSDHIGQFFLDCANGRLPEVSFVEPRFLEESTGLSSDDHPHADLRNGQGFMNLIYRAVTSSRDWHNTLLVFTYDEWGGFFDHVPPPRVDPPSGEPVSQDGLRGFRVPCLLISPFAHRQHVSHLVFDHTSILQFIEWRWKLDPLTERDRTANNLAEALDFSRRNLDAPSYATDTQEFPSPCDVGSADKWDTLAEIAAEWF